MVYTAVDGATIIPLLANAVQARTGLTAHAPTDTDAAHAVATNGNVALDGLLGSSSASSSAPSFSSSAFLSSASTSFFANNTAEAFANTNTANATASAGDAPAALQNVTAQTQALAVTASNTAKKAKRKPTYGKTKYPGFSSAALRDENCSGAANQTTMSSSSSSSSSSSAMKPKRPSYKPAYKASARDKYRSEGGSLTGGAGASAAQTDGANASGRGRGAITLYTGMKQNR
jgi:hypothetical protein